MRELPVIYLLCLVLGAHSPAGGQTASKCFRAEWLQGERVVRLTIDGDKVTGTFTVRGDETAGDATYDFSGTLKGNTVTVAFAGNKLPDVAPSEMKSLVWTLARARGKETLRIRFTGKNYETNKYEEFSAIFEPCAAGPVEAGYGTPPLRADGPRAGDPISSIRRRYASINKNLAKYRVVKKELAGFSTEGGELAAYFDGPAVMKIAATHLGETGRTFEEFYFWDERLIFVFRKEERYDEPLSGRVAKATEHRFYFSDGKLIRWVGEDARPVAPGGSEYQKKQDEYLRDSRRFVEGSRSPKTTIEAPDANP